MMMMMIDRDDFAKSTTRQFVTFFISAPCRFGFGTFFMVFFSSSACIRRHMIYRSAFVRYWGLNIKNNTDVYVEKVLALWGSYIKFIAIKEAHLFLLFDFWESDARLSQDDLYFLHAVYHLRLFVICSNIRRRLCRHH